MSHPPHRRRFLGALALGASTAAMTTPPPLQAGEPEPGPPRPTEVDARMDLLVARYGKHLDDKARGTIRADVAALVRRAETLRKYKLDNGDGPFPVFTPYRAPLR